MDLAAGPFGIASNNGCQLLGANTQSWKLCMYTSKCSQKGQWNKQRHEWGKNEAKAKLTVDKAGIHLRIFVLG